MSLAENVGYIVAFRQFSILFGALAGMTFLGESRHAPKFAGITLMAAGLVLVGLG
jgi:uncharacterized membrane protein